MSNQQDDEKSGKKNRKRLKRLYQQIREQMEFYLSDANLQKDRFLMQQMNSSADGCIDLDVFLRCNKILSLTSDIEVLTNAVATSKTLVVDKKKKKVGRVVPYRELKDVDERTVYVECLPTEADREWIRKVFGACGKIVYISLPRFKSTGDIKGFAFVEYETTESAQKACKIINHPPAEADEKVARLPPNKQLKQLEKQVHFKEQVHGRKRRASESEMERGDLSKAKRKRTVSEGEHEEVQALPAAAAPAKHDPPTIKSKRRKSSESGSGEGKDDATPKETTTTEESQASKSKRKKSSEGGDVTISLESKSETAASKVIGTPSKAVETPSKVVDSILKSKKAKKESKSTKPLEEKTDVKQGSKRARQESTEDVANVETKPETTKKAKKKEETPEAAVEVNVKALKRRTEGDESGEKKVKKVKICEERTLMETKEEPPENEGTGEADDATKKKKRPRKNKKMRTKDIPELRVIPKKQWMNLRAEYLKLQKANMSELKEKLKEIRVDENKSKRTKPAVSDPPSFAAAEEKESDAKAKSEPPEFIEGVIVKVTTDQPVTRNDLKDRIWAFGSIAYIDIKDKDTSAHVRCNDQKTAIAISNLSTAGYSFQRLSGEDEKAYWQKLMNDRNKKLTAKTRTKQRGRDKILHKADDAYEKVKKPLHIIFD